MIYFSGEVAALSAACLWSIASVVYSQLGARIPPLQLNLIKGIIAIALFVFTILARGDLFPSIATLPMCLLLLSGVIGISLGDTLFFNTINSLGARRALLMQTLTSPMSAIFGLFFLQEKLNALAWCGILVTILGVAWVVSERTADVKNISIGEFKKGIVFGLLTAIAGAIGAVLSRSAIADTIISPLWAALVRLSAGTLILLIWKLSRKQASFRHDNFLNSRVILGTFFAAFCGTYLGIWLQQTAIKLTSVGIASTLLQTSPLFVIPFAILMGEKVSIRAILGVFISISGIALLFYL
ncbi:EamA-like transporter family [Rivularia sp. PCC 7116]|uniref:DMT family transporter n=1 Tax=Rivularia sp. PCC 7116 TaxID=373994 RepID=UPI00029F4391|nr:DMT family transporter [Rivularia sp. PCC 7116]AFY53328.1 EamA-like transporter family [Rivularia sp. PCC 7116]